jgi:PhnB protein
MAFHPYLFFAGNCREAFTRYQELFGGELTVMDGTAAPPDAGIPADKVDLVMHASLMSGDELLMASDSYDDDFSPPIGMFVHYTTTDLDRAKAIFDGLSEGGDVQSPGQEEFWTPFFGVVTDRFGTPWQISVEAPAEES